MLEPNGVHGLRWAWYGYGVSFIACQLGSLWDCSNLLLGEPVRSILPDQLLGNVIRRLRPKESFDLRTRRMKGITVFPCPNILGNCLYRIGTAQ